MEKQQNNNAFNVIGKIKLDESHPDFELNISSNAIGEREERITVVSGAIRLVINCTSTIDTFMYLLGAHCSQMFNYCPSNSLFEVTNIGKAHNQRSTHIAIINVIGNVAVAHANLIGIIEHNLSAADNNAEMIDAEVSIDIPTKAKTFVLGAIRRSEHPGIDRIFSELVSYVTV